MQRRKEQNMFDRDIDLNEFSDKELEELEQQQEEKKLEIREELVCVEKELLLIKKELKRRQDRDTPSARRTAYPH